MASMIFIKAPAEIFTLIMREKILDRAAGFSCGGPERIAAICSPEFRSDKNEKSGR